MQHDDNKSRAFRRLTSASTWLLLATALSAAESSLAGPADKVYTPIVEQGELEIEFRGGVADSGTNGRTRAFVMDIGYGISSRWFSEVAVEYAADSGSDGELDAIEWENVFQLTEQGRYWADVGLFVEYEYALESGSPDELIFGPMFQKDIGPSQLNLNLLIEREIGSNAGNDTELGYAAQIKWRGHPKHELGFQAFGEENSHSIGPAFFGSYRFRDTSKLKFDAAVLAGVTEGAPDLTVRFQFEWEMN